MGLRGRQRLLRTVPMSVRTSLTISLMMSALALTACSGGGSNDPTSSQPPPVSNPSSNAPTLSIEDATVGEADGSVTVHVKASAASRDEIMVDYNTVDGSATAGADYVSGSGTLDYPAGTTDQTVVVDLVNDTTPEPEESFHIKLSNPMNADIADGDGVVTIVDDDTSAVCGAPSIDAAADNGVFVWKDCSAGVWHVRVTNVASGTRYQGKLLASAGSLDNVTPVATEGDDAVTTPGQAEVDYTLTTDTGTEGFDFHASQDAGTCFGVSAPASAAGVLVGAGRLEVQAPFDLKTLAPCDTGGSASAGNYDVVVVFTDDQRFDTLKFMPNVTSRLVANGVDFTNAYVPTPLCCPARASTYSGGYLAQNTGVLDNNDPNGGMAAFDDSTNVGTRLQSIGYRTMFVGKWLNDYPNFTPYVPPGWDKFVGRAVYATITDWTDFRYIVGSSDTQSSMGSEVGAAGEYNAYFERDQITSFIDSTPADQPLLVFWSTTAPHPPFSPDEQDKSAFSNFTYRGRGYGETDLSDKPGWVQHPGVEDPTGSDEDVRNQLRTLLGLDRAIGTILDDLKARGRLDRTIFILTSDNGYMWGEHGLWAKNKPYEESLRVPMVVMMPGVASRTDAHLVSGVLDLVPTIYDALGISAHSDGMSLVPLLRDPQTPWRDELFFEKTTAAQYPNGMWAGLRRNDWKYIEYADGEEELYDLASDPYELENLAGDAAHESVRAAMAQRVDELRGIGIKPIRHDIVGTVAKPFSLTLEPWGGKAPLTWKIETGNLPPGLELNPASGEISGTPTTAGSWTFSARVTSASSDLATQRGEPKTFVSHALTIQIQ